MGFIIGGQYPQQREVAPERPESENKAMEDAPAVVEAEAVASEEPVKNPRRGRRRNVKE